MSDVVLTNIVKQYEGAPAPAIRDLTLTLPSGEFVCLLGPSGCGKTTTLRMIAGLEHPSGGSLRYGERVFSDADQAAFVPPEKRDLGLMFQSYALWPHLTVGENIAFGLEMKRVPRETREARVAEMEQLFRLDGLRKRYPSELSGGQQQRVALARMLAVSPTLLLLDEPLSNLDAALRLEMRAELKRLHKTLGCTIVFVTHDQFEAMSLATSIVVMEEGDVVQMAPPLDIYHEPASLFVAQFVGNPPMNVFAAAQQPDLASWVERHTGRSGTTVGIRPESLRLHATPGDGRLAATIDSIQPTGAECITSITIEGLTMFVLASELPPAAEGESVYLGLAPAGVHTFDDSGATIKKAPRA